MNMIDRLQFFYNSCFFCGQKGLCLSSKNNNGEMPVCQDCARKLIVGVSTALENLNRMNEELIASQEAAAVAPEAEVVAAPEAEAAPVVEESVPAVEVVSEVVGEEIVEEVVPAAEVAAEPAPETVV